jgi:hypothetical protein
MYRPAFVSKLRINYPKTWAHLRQLFKQPAPIRPSATPAHLVEVLTPQKFRLPQIKGNVVHTMEQIIAIFMDNWKKAAKPINVAIQTTRTSLAKRCHNRDPKTAYRHILALIQAGFLRAKVHVRGGLQLLINPDLIIFDAAPAVVQAALVPNDLSQVMPPNVTLQQGLNNLHALAQKFDTNRVDHCLKNSMRAFRASL